MINYAIIENEEYSLLNLRRQIEQLRPDYRFVFSNETVEEAVTFLGSRPQLDLVFMDIELDDGNCFDIFRQVGSIDVPVVFTTAYDQYAIQAFKVNSVDYLLKPIMDDDLLVAIEKFERNRVARPDMDFQQLLSQISNFKPQTSKPSRILITSGDTYQYVEIADVAFFMAEDKYVFAYLKSGRRRLTDFHSLSDVLPVLPSSEFFQISRSIIASIGSISRVSKHFKGRLQVMVEAGEVKQEAIVTSARKQDFLTWYGFKV